MSTSPPPSRPDDGLRPPVTVDMLVEVPRFSFVKRLGDGTIDFVSPLPTPFNYGSVPQTQAPDGDAVDVLLLGPRQPAGVRVRVEVHGVVHFVDDGQDDPKLVAGPRPPTAAQMLQVRAFFALYAHAKSLLNRLRGRHGSTEVVAVHVPAPPEAIRSWLTP